MKLTARYAILLILVVLIAGLLLPTGQTVSAQTTCKFKTLSSANCQLITDAGANLDSMPTFVLDYTSSFQASGLSTGNINFSLNGSGPMDFTDVDSADYVDTLSEAVFSSKLTSKLTSGSKTTSGTLDLRMVDGILYAAGSLVPQKTGVKFDVDEVLQSLPYTLQYLLLPRRMEFDTLDAVQKNGLAAIPGIYQITAQSGRAIEGQSTTQISLSLNVDPLVNYIVDPDHRQILESLLGEGGQTLTDAQINQIQRVMPLLEPTLKATKLQETWLIGNQDHFYHGWALTFSTRVDPTLASLLGVSVGAKNPQPVTMNAALQLTFTKIGEPVTAHGLDDAVDQTDLAVDQINSKLGGNALTAGLVPTEPTFPTDTPAPTETLLPNAFSMDGATLYTSPDKLIQMNVPTTFEVTAQAYLKLYYFTYKGSPNQPAIVQVTVGNPATLYKDYLNLTGPVSSPADALNQVAKSINDSGFTFSPVKPGKIGDLDAQVIDLSIAADPSEPYITGKQDEILLAPLADGEIVMVLENASIDLWPQAKPTFDAMVDSLRVNLPETITPTVTPMITSTVAPTTASTVVPLLLTATALQSQILALTPSAMATTEESPTATPSLTPSPTAVLPPVNYRYILQGTTADGAPILGDPNAKITLMLFEDYSCPTCLTYAPAVTAVIAKFVQPGQARLIVEPETYVGKDFSDNAAQAALCAGKQNQYWEMRDALYNLQATKGYLSFTPDGLGNLATSLNMNAAELMSCVLSDETEPVVQKASKLGDSLNVVSLPAMLWSTDGKTFKFFTDSAGKTIVPTTDDIASLIEQGSRVALPTDTAQPTIQPTIQPTSTPSLTPIAATATVATPEPATATSTATGSLY